MSLKLVTGETPDNDDVLTLAEFKAFLVDVPDSEDDEATQAINSAVEDLERHTGRAYGSRKYDLVLDSFPSGEFCLEMPPLIAVDSVKYTNTSDAEITLAEDTDYTVHGVNVTGLNNNDEYGGYIKPVDSGWPSDVKDGDEVVTIRFTAGYATPNIVPARAKQGARIRANKYFSFKGATYDAEADKLYWETIHDLIVHSFA